MQCEPCVVVRIPVASIFEDPAWPDLEKEYAAECSIAMIGPIQPQPQIYDAMEKAGVLRCFGAYRNGDMIGFATVLIPVLPHYGKRPATVESLFVTKGERKGGTFARLRRAIKDGVRDVSEVMLYSAPAGGAMEMILSHDPACVKTNVIFAEKL